MSFVPDRGLNTAGRSTTGDLEDELPDQGDTGFPELSANAITAHLAATFAGLPVYVHAIAHADGVALVDTGDTRGHQSVLVDTLDGLVVIGGDVAYTFDELGSGVTEGQRRVLALAAPTWLTHAEGGPKVPRPN